jgi:hypothetical protein
MVSEDDDEQEMDDDDDDESVGYDIAASFDAKDPIGTFQEDTSILRCSVRQMVCVSDWR